MSARFERDRCVADVLKSAALPQHRDHVQLSNDGTQAVLDRGSMVEREVLVARARSLASSKPSVNKVRRQNGQGIADHPRDPQRHARSMRLARSAWGGFPLNSGESSR